MIRQAPSPRFVSWSVSKAGSSSSDKVRLTVERAIVQEEEEGKDRSREPEERGDDLTHVTYVINTNLCDGLMV
jgi:hypothetical protein